MACAVCRKLKADVERLRRAHSESKIALENNQQAPYAEYHALRTKEADARMALEIMSYEMRLHERQSHRYSLSEGRSSMPEGRRAKPTERESAATSQNLPLQSLT